MKLQDTTIQIKSANILSGDRCKCLHSLTKLAKQFHYGNQLRQKLDTSSRRRKLKNGMKRLCILKK
eukprot:3977673-Amphidinium_carterae.1